MRERSTATAQRRPVRRRWRLPAIAAVVALAALILASPVRAATNLLANGEFSSSTVAPWTDSLGVLYLSNLDRSGNPDSGSALLVDQNAAAFYAASMISECVRIQGGVQADIGGWFKGGSRVPPGSKTRLRRIYYSDASCSTYISGGGGVYVSVPSAWATITNPGTTPQNTQSMRMVIDALSGSGSNLDLLSDGLFLMASAQPLPGTIFASGFENGTTGWAVVK